ncbi:MAG: tetratricopeptide repeat protein [Gammaproteobacteria bacterium]|nr:tetratricopeptide repeat protein [Gammaproteobacteria bacterium]
MTTNTTGGDSRHAQLPELLRQAVVAHEDGDLEAAYPLYRQFAKENPRHPTALQLFGLLLSQRGMYESAVVLMQESLQLFPDQAEVANNLGNALVRCGRFDEAIASYDNAIRIFPEYVDALRNRGLCYAQANRLDDAAASFERCLEFRPADPASWLSLGNIRQQQGNLADALECFEKALELNPDYADAHHNLGLVLRLMQRPEEALEHYETAQKLGLDRPELSHNIGNALIDMHQPDRAIDSYKAALARNPGDLDTHKNLNSLLWQQDYLDDYLSSYRVALKDDPAAVPLRLAYARSLTQIEDFDEAASVLQEGLHHTPNDSETKSLLAYAREGQGRWDDALLVHEAAVNMPGSTPMHRISYARALLACKRPDEALQHVQAGAAQMPYNQRALAYLGLCWRMLDDERDAVLNDYENLVRAYDVPVPSGFANATEFNESLGRVLEPLHIAKRYPAEQTLRGGSQTSGNLFNLRDQEILDLVAGIKECVQDYVGRFPANKEHPLFARNNDIYRFAASWSVRLGRCGYHKMHTHPLGWISSAYYVQVPPEIVESDEHGGGIKFGEPDIDLGEKGQARRLIQPTTGRLVLFPSYMWHGTVPFESDDPRMTVAFDVVPGVQ